MQPRARRAGEMWPGGLLTRLLPLWAASSSPGSESCPPLPPPEPSVDLLMMEGLGLEAGLVGAVPCPSDWGPRDCHRPLPSNISLLPTERRPQDRDVVKTRPPARLARSQAAPGGGRGS